jgi:hypothetical protein
MIRIKAGASQLPTQAEKEVPDEFVSLELVPVVVELPGTPVVVEDDVPVVLELSSCVPAQVAIAGTTDCAAAAAIFAALNGELFSRSVASFCMQEAKPSVPG